MKIDKKRLQDDIAEAFDFARFLVRHPRMLRKVRNGVEIEFLPEASRRLSRAAPRLKRVQSFYAERVFRSS